MRMKTISVTFKTLTPIYFGNAIQTFEEIRPSEILGCMRFWLDVVSVCQNSTNFKYLDDLDKSIKDRSKKEKKNEEIDEIILKKLFEKPNDSWEQMISEEFKRIFNIQKLSDWLFGCESFKGQISIENVDIKNNIAYIGKTRINIKKTNNNNKHNYRNNNDSFWYLPERVYMGEFTIKFKVNEHLVKEIFYPLLYFINEVGYLGGKWNLGLGRVEIVEVSDKSLDRKVNLKDYNDFESCINTIKSSENYDITKHFESLKKGNNDSFRSLKEENNDNQEKVVKYIIDSKYELLEKDNIYKNDKKRIDAIDAYKKIIKRLLNKKIEFRNIIREKEDDKNENANDYKNIRHKVFGITSSKENQGSKILPYVGRDAEGKYITGFLLLDGLYNVKALSKSENQVD